MAQTATEVTVREHVGRLRTRLKAAGTLAEVRSVIHGVLDLLVDELGEDPPTEVKGNDPR